MLVLSRKKNEAVHINDDIVVRIVEIRGDKVRLGFEAPTEHAIHRGEVYDAIQRDKAPDAPADNTGLVDGSTEGAV